MSDGYQIPFRESKTVGALGWFLVYFFCGGHWVRTL